MLYYHHMKQIKGKVIRGKQRGRNLGYPTANIKVSGVSEGIYVSHTFINGLVHKSVTFIGSAKTFGEKDVFAETYILDFDNDIYDQDIEIKLIKKIRSNKKFDTIDALVLQIKKDVEQACQYFKNV